jgi:uncharacterized damage-inducible protein DinB
MKKSAGNTLNLQGILVSANEIPFSEKNSMLKITLRSKPSMKYLALAFAVLLSIPAAAQNQKPVTLRSILLEQLRTTHKIQDWFVPPSLAVAGVTAEQATWTDKSGNHSIGQLTNHILFWDSRELTKFKGEPPSKYNGNNDETFNSFDAKSWASTIEQLDKVLNDIEKFVETCDDATLQKYASEIAHIGTHNAYHTGQILYIRKQQGIWDPAKGVK